MNILFISSLIFFLSINAQEKIDKSFDGITKIDMELSFGNCTIVESRSSKVRVLVDDYDKRNQEIRIEQQGKKLFIKTRNNDSRNSIFGASSKTEWFLEIPNNIELDFSTGSGDVSIENISFEKSDINTGSGEIELLKTNGKISLNTGSGRLKIDECSGFISAHTGSGNIQLKGFVGRINASTGSGGIVGSNLSGGFKLDTGSGKIYLRAITIEKRTTMNTGSGGIEITLAKKLNDDITLKTGSGNVLLDFSGNKIEGYFEMTAGHESGIKAPFKFDQTEKNNSWGKSTKSANIGSRDIDITLSTSSGKVAIRK